LDFDEHLSSNPNSEIIGELNRINTVLQGFITDIEAENQNPTLIPLVQNYRGPIHFLVLHEKYEKHEECQIKNHNAYFVFQMWI
jgi:hypothetical protein